MGCVKVTLYRINPAWLLIFPLDHTAQDFSLSGEHPCICVNVCVCVWALMLSGGLWMRSWSKMFVFSLIKQCRQLCVRVINSYINTHAVDSCYITAEMLYLQWVSQRSGEEARVGRGKRGNQRNLMKIFGRIFLFCHNQTLVCSRLDGVSVHVCAGNLEGFVRMNLFWLDSPMLCRKYRKPACIVD